MSTTPASQTPARIAALTIKIAKALYEDDQRLTIARAKEDNRGLKRDSVFRANEQPMDWNQLCRSGGWMGEHPRDRYLRYAQIALRMTNHS